MVCTQQNTEIPGNDNVGTTLHGVFVEQEGKVSVQIPFPTHGSFPAYDGKQFVYVYEDSDSAHQNRFGRVNLAKLVFENLPADETHTRFSSMCFQQNKIWKISSQKLKYYDVTTQIWQSTNLTCSASLLVADLHNVDQIWLISVALHVYSIRNNTLTRVSTGADADLGYNQSAVFIPTDSNQGGIIAALKGSCKMYDISKNSWKILNLPSISKTDTVQMCYDELRGTVWAHSKDKLKWQKMNFLSPKQ